MNVISQKLADNKEYQAKDMLFDKNGGQAESRGQQEEASSEDLESFLNAAKCGDMEELQRYKDIDLEQGADSEGLTALLLSAKLKDARCFDYLRKLGANKLAKAKNGWNVRHLAAAAGSTAVLETIASWESSSLKPAKDDITPGDRETLLHLVVRSELRAHEFPATKHILKNCSRNEIEYGNMLLKKNSRGESPLHIAVGAGTTSGNAPLIKILLTEVTAKNEGNQYTNTPDPDFAAENDEGRSALVIAIDNADVNSVAALLEGARNLNSNMDRVIDGSAMEASKKLLANAKNEEEKHTANAIAGHLKSFREGRGQVTMDSIGSRLRVAAANGWLEDYINEKGETKLGVKSCLVQIRSFDVINEKHIDNQEGRTALYNAIVHSGSTLSSRWETQTRAQIIKHILVAGASINAFTGPGGFDSELYAGLRWISPEVFLNELLKRANKRDMQPPDTATALQIVTSVQNPKAASINAVLSRARELGIDIGEFVNAAYGRKAAPIEAAKRSWDIVEILINHGATVTTAVMDWWKTKWVELLALLKRCDTHQGAVPPVGILSYWLERGTDEQIVELLSKVSSKEVLISGKSEVTALQIVTSVQNPKAASINAVLSRARELGIDIREFVNAAYGRKAAPIEAAKRSWDIVEILINHGATVTTAVMDWWKTKWVELLALLKRCDTHQGAVPPVGILSYWLERGTDEQIVELLSKVSSKEVLISGKSEVTALQIVTSVQNPKAASINAVLSRARELGIDIGEFVNAAYGRKAAPIEAAKRSWDIVEILINHGATVSIKPILRYALENYDVSNVETLLIIIRKRQKLSEVFEYEDENGTLLQWAVVKKWSNKVNLLVSMAPDKAQFCSQVGVHQQKPAVLLASSIEIIKALEMDRMHALNAFFYWTLTCNIQFVEYCFDSFDWIPTSTRNETQTAMDWAHSYFKRWNITATATDDRWKTLVTIIKKYMPENWSRYLEFVLYNSSATVVYSILDASERVNSQSRLMRMIMKGISVEPWTQVFKVTPESQLEELITKFASDDELEWILSNKSKSGQEWLFAMFGSNCWSEIYSKIHESWAQSTKVWAFARSEIDKEEARKKKEAEDQVRKEQEAKEAKRKLEETRRRREIEAIKKAKEAEERRERQRVIERQDGFARRGCDMSSTVEEVWPSASRCTKSKPPQRIERFIQIICESAQHVHALEYFLELDASIETLLRQKVVEWCIASGWIDGLRLLMSRGADITESQCARLLERKDRRSLEFVISDYLSGSCDTSISGKTTAEWCIQLQWTDGINVCRSNGAVVTKKMFLFLVEVNATNTCREIVASGKVENSWLTSNSDDGCTNVFHMAAELSSCEMLEILTSHPHCSPEMLDILRRGKAPMLISKNKEFHMKLIEKGATISSSIFLHSVENKDWHHVVNYVLSRYRGENLWTLLSASNSSGNAIQIAVKGLHADVVRALLNAVSESEAYANSSTLEEPKPPLALQVCWGHHDLVLTLIEFGGKIPSDLFFSTIRDVDWCGKVLTKIKASQGTVAIDTILAFVSSSYGSSLQHAVNSGNIEAVRLLLTFASASVHDEGELYVNQASERFGDPPILLARSFEVFELLVEHGASLLCSSADGTTPLHKYTSIDETRAIEFIIDKLQQQGPKALQKAISARNNMGECAFHLVVSMTACTLLLDAGSKPLWQNTMGQTCLFLQIVAGRLDVAKLMKLRHKDFDEGRRRMISRRVDRGSLRSTFERTLNACVYRGERTVVEAVVLDWNQEALEFILSLIKEVLGPDALTQIVASKNKVEELHNFTLLRYLLVCGGWGKDHREEWNQESLFFWSVEYAVTQCWDYKRIEKLIKFWLTPSMSGKDIVASSVSEVCARGGIMHILIESTTPERKKESDEWGRDDGGAASLVTFLIERGLDATITDKDGKNAEAVMKGWDSLRILWSDWGSSSWVTNKSRRRFLSLRYACQDGDWSKVKEILGRSDSPDVNEQDDSGITALMASVSGGVDHAKCIDILFRHGAKGELTKFSDKATAIHIAAEGGYHHTIRALSRWGIKVNARDDMNWTALHRAALNDKVLAVVALLEARADRDLKDSDSGRTPLIWAALRTFWDVCRALIRGGAVCRCAKDSDGKTAYDHSPGGREYLWLKCGYSTGYEGAGMSGLVPWMSWTSLGERKQGFPAHAGLELKRNSFDTKVLSQDTEHCKQLGDVLDKASSKRGKELRAKTSSSGYGRVSARSPEHYRDDVQPPRIPVWHSRERHGNSTADMLYKARKSVRMARAKSSTQLLPREMLSPDRGSVSPQALTRPRSAPAGRTSSQAQSPYQPYNPDRRKMPLAGNWKPYGPEVPLRVPGLYADW